MIQQGELREKIANWFFVTYDWLCSKTPISEPLLEQLGVLFQKSERRMAKSSYQNQQAEVKNDL